MSHFIDTDQVVEAPPIFELKSKEVVKPKTDKIGKSICYRKHYRRKTQASIQNKYMQGIYDQLLDNERDQVNIENAQQIKQSYTNLKHKWSRSCEESSGLAELFQAKRNNFYNSFQNGRHRLNLKTVYGQMPKKVELAIKHSNKIVLKYGSVHELEEIRQSKEKYQGWFNKTKNHISKSPIFKSMNKVLKEIQSANCYQPTPVSYPTQVSTSQRKNYESLSKNKKNHHNILGFSLKKEEKFVRSLAQLRKKSENQ